MIILSEVDLENVSPSVRLNVSGVVNTLTANGKYPVQGYENLQLPIQMQLSQKGKTFSPFFAPFLDSISNFEHFERKDDRHSIFLKLQTVKFFLENLLKSTVSEQALAVNM